MSNNRNSQSQVQYNPLDLTGLAADAQSLDTFKEKRNLLNQFNDLLASLSSEENSEKLEVQFNQAKELLRELNYNEALKNYSFNLGENAFLSLVATVKSSPVLQDSLETHFKKPSQECLEDLIPATQKKEWTALIARVESKINYPNESSELLSLEKQVKGDLGLLLSNQISANEYRDLILLRVEETPDSPRGFVEDVLTRNTSYWIREKLKDEKTAEEVAFKVGEATFYSNLQINVKMLDYFLKDRQIQAQLAGRDIGVSLASMKSLEKNGNSFLEGWINKESYEISDSHRNWIANVFSDMPLATNFENALKEVKEIVSISNPNLQYILTLGLGRLQPYYSDRLTYESVSKPGPELTNKQDNIPTPKI